MYDISSSLNSNITFNLSLPSASLGEDSFQSQQTIFAGSEPSSGEIDISGLVIDLTTDFNQPYNKIPLIFSVFLNSGSDLITLTNEDFADINFPFLI